MYTYKTLIRDKLVDNANIKTLFGATATGSCHINMENLKTTATFPQIIIGYDGGQTVPNMNADESTISLSIECRGSGGIHAHKEIGNFRSKILAIIDDTSLQSNTAVCYHIRKFSEAYGYDEDKNIHWLRMDFNCDFKQNTNFA